MCGSKVFLWGKLWDHFREVRKAIKAEGLEECGLIFGKLHFSIIHLSILDITFMDSVTSPLDLIRNSLDMS